VHYTVTATGGTPTGTVNVDDGSGGSCSGTVAAGQCTITFASAGARTLTATYSGDANFSGSTSPNFGHQVNTASTTTAITSDTPDPSIVGQSYTVNFSISVTAPGGGTPTGNVLVSDGLDTCSGTVAAGSCVLASTTAGAKNLTATYAGDGNYTGSTSATASHTVNKASTTTAITSDTPDPSSVGGVVAVDFTVTSTGGTPTGNVTVTDGTDSCTGTVAAGTCNITLTTPGSRPLTASYAGNANFNGSTSPSEPHIVSLNGSTTTITSDTPDPSVVGQSVLVNFTVSGGLTPTGSVNVSDGTDSCNGTLSGGSGSCSLALSTAGARTLVAVYGGDGLHGGSTSAGAAHTVTPASTTTAITGDTPDPSTQGQSVAVTYTVTSTGGTPTGNVTVTDGVDSCNGTVAAGTCSLALTTVGSRPLTATYAGDANFTGSTSAAAAHTVSLPSTTTTITSDLPDPSVIGQGITVDVSVTSGAGTPTGGGTVSDGTDNCSFTLSGGLGSCLLTPTTAGAKTLTATYSGSSGFAGSGGTEPHQVNASGAVSAAQSTVAVAPGSLTASSGSSASTITVTAKDGFGNPISGATVVLAATGTGNTLTQPAGPTNGSGVATGTLSSTGAGTKTVSATINGVAITQTQGVSVAPGPADAASSTAIVPSGSAGNPTVITIQAIDAFGNPLTTGGATVVVTVSGTNTAGPLTATDNGDGTYTATYTPSASGPDQVDITLNGTPISGSPYNTTVALGSPSQIQLFAGNNQTAPVGTLLAARPTVIVRVAGNYPLSGVSVSFAVTGGGGTITSGTQATDQSGLADVGWTLGTTSGANTLTATVTGLSGSPVVFSATAIPGPVDASQTTASVPPGTSGSPTTMVIQSRDAFGNAETTSGGSLTVTIAGANAGSVPTVSDHGDGSYSATYTPTVAGTDIVTIELGGTGISGSPFTSIVAPGGVNSSQSTVALSTATLVASAGANSTVITVTARDASGNPIPGANVVLAATGGTGDDLVQPAGLTDGSGQAQGAFSATGSGIWTIRATVDGVLIAQSQSVTITPDVSDPLAATAVVPDGSVGTPTVLVIQARDQFGNAVTVGGNVVTVDVTGANHVTPVVTDNGDGTYTAGYTPTSPGQDSVHIKMEGKTILGSPFLSTVS
jgi:hypothetical protein